MRRVMYTRMWKKWGRNTGEKEEWKYEGVKERKK
jgi:hypothetical protein